jgi:hypothetical protein
MRMPIFEAFSLIFTAMLNGQSVIPEVMPSVCVSVNGFMPDHGALKRAEILASKMFQTVGVAIEWRANDRSCPVGGIQIDLSTDTPASRRPGALAEAFCYEGSHIFIFLDRILANHEADAVTTVLAHVMVHEITHMLEGISRHSAYGVMKAKWDRADFLDMEWRPLGFAKEDVALIQAGMAARENRAALAKGLGRPSLLEATASVSRNICGLIETSACLPAVLDRAEIQHPF